MRFYDQQHRFYAGVDRHARTLHLCIRHAQGAIVFDKNLHCRPDAFLAAVAPFHAELVVGAECMLG
jgi:hypothetical protein